jgi:enamine deaminase RidA (YjgF/YER057c/UK114 family)
VTREFVGVLNSVWHALSLSSSGVSRPNRDIPELCQFLEAEFRLFKISPLLPASPAAERAGWRYDRRTDNWRRPTLSAVRRWNPPTIAPPIGKYSHLAEVPAGHRVVHVSGQVGNLPDGSLAGPGAAEQTRQIFANLQALFTHLGVTPAHAVKLLTFVAGTEHLAGFAEARDEVFARWYPDGCYPGHSLAVVAALAAPGLAVEMEAIIAVPVNDRSEPGQ